MDLPARNDGLVPSGADGKEGGVVIKPRFCEGNSVTVVTRLHLLSMLLSVGLGRVDVFSDDGAIPTAARGILVAATVKTEELRGGLLVSGTLTDATAALANANDLLTWVSEGVKDATASAKVIPGCPDCPLTEPAI